MSIENIKELFSKRVQESDSYNLLDKSSDKKNSSVSNGDNEDEQQLSSLKETDAGITEYLSDSKGFNAVIKQRFSDFHVHEIDKDGNVVSLTDTSIPEVTVEPFDDSFVSKEIWDKLESLHDKVVESVEIDVTEVDKEKRKDIHKAIKNKYGSLFNSNTKDLGDKKLLVVSFGKETKRNDWCSGVGPFLHFVLFKKNLDTMDAINIIASLLRTKPANLTYAGTKDKRANTSQMVSMWHLDAKRLNGINKLLRGMKVGNYTYKNTPLKLGDLKGNLFEIALRNVTESDEVVNTALETLKQNGFLNYFGLQRFGNCYEIPTYEIGRALIKGNFKMAVELILKPRQGKTKNDLREARKIWWETRDAVRALKCLRSKDRTIEGKLLQGLAKHGKNAFVNALDCVPRNMRLMYLHSYQSLLWNKVLSKRINQFGKSVIEGDLVFTQESEEMNGEIIESTDEEPVPTPTDDEPVPTSTDDEPVPPSNNIVKCLSSNEVNDYKITDVIHPLPGWNVTYPDNIIKEWYEELLKEDDLTFDTLKQTVKKYSLSGTYRHIVKKVNDLSWYMCNYSEAEDDLILSDLDKMEGRELEIDKNCDQKYRAVVLKLSLDSSTYATMALREVLKIDTSYSYQSTLNSYSNKRTSEFDEEDSRKKSKN